MSTPLYNIGPALRWYRLNVLRKSQREIAAVGRFSYVTLCRVEKSACADTPPQTIVRLCAAYEIPLPILLALADESAPTMKVSEFKKLRAGLRRATRTASGPIPAPAMP